MGEGLNPVTEGLTPAEILGFPYSDNEADKQTVSVQPNARVGEGSDPVIEAVAPIEIVGLP